MLLDPLAPAEPAATPSGAPTHCQEPMRLAASAGTSDPSGEGAPLDWRCRCGFRLDAGLIPLPFPGSHDAGLVAS
ncbi:hypothetical protein SA2016_2832 [Sinomonas atrocyanea]|uniref:Uncharacterized protein n=1 Tax=Sinomonas atrocyanea TaxID=37927 RepID=A0A127A2S6_9MICC|nr:hypothetical protein [Sinomonas atrocyanea]AMM33497.1 hypothetical protein SA2016_2832 [Sinomonas atrocyanea]GEB62939.1 hypothetical protein SAT01_03870 [Sinomonas atrocyanea]GGG62058.1 hypothetical protein GCM10007172_11500 [Sinomonas atrocyanea]